MIGSAAAIRSRGRPTRTEIPWRRLASLMAPVRPALMAMVALTGVGSLVGLVPALALGSLVDDLAGSRHGKAMVAGALIVAAIVIEAIAFTLSDGFFSKAVSGLYRDLRVMMFSGAQRTQQKSAEHLAGLTSRFVSDAEAMQELIVSPLDTAVMGAFELVSALIALAILNAPGAGVAIVLGLLATMLARLLQAPAASAAQERQEALEGMSRSLAAELSRRLQDGDGRGRFAHAATRVLRREVRLGWLEAASRYGSGAAASLGPIAVVIVAALTAGLKAGTLLSIFLLAQRAFSAADDLLEIGLDVELVRGAIARCFELVDSQMGQYAQPAEDVTGASGNAGQDLPEAQLSLATTT
jgi:ABC-type multidrug transport system fused ATPase/permease subunit